MGLWKNIVLTCSFCLLSFSWLLQFNIIAVIMKKKHVRRGDLVKGDKSDKKNNFIFINVESFCPNQPQQEILWITYCMQVFCLLWNFIGLKTISCSFRTCVILGKDSQNSYLQQFIKMLLFIVMNLTYNLEAFLDYVFSLLKPIYCFVELFN